MCQAEDLIIDPHSSYLVCTKCGVVNETIYQNECREPSGATALHSRKETCVYETIKDILDRIHISTKYADRILRYYFKFYKGFNLRSIVFSCYMVLNEHYDFNISLKYLLNANGFSGESTSRDQRTNENVTLDIAEMIEKYTSMLKLSFKDTSLIKEMIRKKRLSGHTPLTTIASNIYIYCKQNQKKVSIKKIAEVTQVSCISIQRYLKKNVAA